MVIKTPTSLVGATGNVQYRGKRMRRTPETSPIRAGAGNLDTGVSGFLAGHNRRIEVHEEARTYTANAGNAHICGGEFEIHTLVTQELVVSLNAGGYTHAALVSGNLLDSNFNPGTPLQYDPKWTASASLVNRHQLMDQFALTARADTTCVGSRRNATYAINTLPSYQLTNIRGGLKGKNGPQFCS
jgi:hypothetical protein